MAAAVAKEEPAAGDYEFKLPDFDEDQFIHREMVSFKTTSILFGWGIVAAAASWVAFNGVHGNTNTGWLLGLLLCASFGFSLKWLFPKLGADIGHFKRREWTGTGFLFFFTWLAFFMVAINPPISDFSPPQVIISSDPPTQLPNGTVSLSMLVVDNDRVADSGMTISRDGGPATAPVQTGMASDVRWFNQTNLLPGKYVVAGTGRDAHGLTSTRYANFTVGAQGFALERPHGDILDSTSKLVAHLGTFPSCDKAHYGREPCLRTVYLHTASGDIAMDASADKAGDWSADASSKGWSKGINSFVVRAEFLNHFAGAHSVPGGVLELPGPFSVNVTTQPGTHVADVPGPVANRALNVPHLELPALAVVLVGVAAVMRRRVSP